MNPKTSLSLCLFLSLALASNSAFALDLDGKTYTCQGQYQAPQGPALPYTSKLKIKKQGVAYSFEESDTYTQDQSAEHFTQIALKQGNQFSTAFRSDTDPRKFGSEIFTSLKGGKKLVGTFVSLENTAALGQESCELDEANPNTYKTQR